jgi:hypothetical protein
MAGFDPKSFGIDSRTDTGVFLFFGALAGTAEAILNFAHSDPFTVGALFGAFVVGAKKLLLDTDKVQARRDPEDGRRQPD